MDKIKLDVIGHGDLTSQPWEDGWDTIHGLAAAVREGVLDPDSRVEGELRVSVASRSEVAKVNERFGVGVKVDENLQQFEDREVLKAVSTKYASGSIISKTAFENLTDCDLRGNNDIQYFDEFAECKKITRYTGQFLNCMKLKRVDLSNITSLSIGCLGSVSGSPKTGTVFYFPNVTKIDARPKGAARVDFIGFATLEKITSHGLEESQSGFVDFGSKITEFGHDDIKYGAIRATTPPNPTNASNGINRIFVPVGCASAYKSAYSWYSNKNISEIGSPEWQTAMRTLATQYAAEYAGWSAEQIATADYSDPYIDYRIFGLEPPTE